MPYIRRVGYLLVLIVGAALLSAMVWRPAPPKPFVGLASRDVPREVGGYAAPRDYEMTADVKAMLQGADTVSRTYSQGPDTIDFVLLGGNTRENLHDPRSCLAGAGWALADDHTERLPGTGVDVHACRAIGLPGVPGFDVLYLYVVDGKRISAVSQIRMQMLMSALVGKQNAPVYMLRFMEPLSDDPITFAANHARMMQFASQMWTVMQPKLQTKA